MSQALQLGWEEVAGRHDMADEVLDFRRSVEGLLAGLAAQRRTGSGFAASALLACGAGVGLRAA